MIKLLHRIFHHKAWLLPVPVTFIGISGAMVLHMFGVSLIQIVAVAWMAAYILIAVVFVVLAIVILCWIFPALKENW